MRSTYRACLLASLLLTTLAAAAPKPAYQYIRAGAAADVVRTTSPGFVLMGGGTDVDAAFQWMCGRSGGGDFLVIRATGTDAYNPYIQQLCPANNSVATLIIPTSAAAADPFVQATIDRAEAIWIAGGDQSDYITQWTATPVQAALNNAITRGVPIGGTSAGLNVLTQFVYSAAASQGATSSQALANPYAKTMTFARDFVNIAALGGVIGDPHFVVRDRMGRDLAFLCRVYNNGWSAAPRGIAVDEATALLIEPTGAVQITGQSTAYFLSAPGAPQVCAAKQPLTYRDVNVYRIQAGSGATFQLQSWTGAGGIAYRISADAGVLSSTQAGGSIY